MTAIHHAESMIVSAECDHAAPCGFGRRDAYTEETERRFGQDNLPSTERGDDNQSIRYAGKQVLHDDARR